jgi:hypothetical protein
VVLGAKGIGRERAITMLSRLIEIKKGIKKDTTILTLFI